MLQFKNCSADPETFGTETFIEKEFFQSLTQVTQKKKNPNTLSRRRTYDLLVTSPDAQPLSYRRLVRAANATLLLLKTVQ